MAKQETRPEDQRTILGFTLSKRGWNNVLIYLVLGLMFVFYFLGHKSGEIAGQQTVEPFTDQMIVEISDRQNHWIRVGANWEQRSGDAMDTEIFRRWLSAWQRVQFEPTEQLLSGEEYVVEITLADSPEPLRIGVFYQNNEALIAFPGADVTYRVIAPEPEQLKPQ